MLARLRNLVELTFHQFKASGPTNLFKVQKLLLDIYQVPIHNQIYTQLILDRDSSLEDHLHHLILNLVGYFVNPPRHFDIVHRVLRRCQQF